MSNQILTNQNFTNSDLACFIKNLRSRLCFDNFQTSVLKPVNQMEELGLRLNVNVLSQELPLRHSKCFFVIDSHNIYFFSESGGQQINIFFEELSNSFQNKLSRLRSQIFGLYLFEAFIVEKKLILSDILIKKGKDVRNEPFLNRQILLKGFSDQHNFAHYQANAGTKAKENLRRKLQKQSNKDQSLITSIVYRDKTSKYGDVLQQNTIKIQPNLVDHNSSERPAAA
ncbi:MAG TPA: hypothetical protein PKY82_34245 [Pyrinomonadaceae bacterium]|nr:hypothetical protein [Pyrinomonadaceae bacterium]